MKKFLFVLALVVLFSLAACNNEIQNGTVQAEIPNETAPSDNTLKHPNPGGIFCTEGLAEGEVLTVSADGDYVLFDSIDEMLRFATSSDSARVEIVRVEVLDERTDWHNTTAAWQHEGALPFLAQYDNAGWDLSDNYEPYTFYRVLVLDVFLGEAEIGDILEVMQLGGQVDNVHLENQHFTPLVPGDDLVLFLSSPSWMGNSPAGIISPSQAAYHFPDLSGGIRAFGLDESLESVYQFPAHMAEFALPLTLDDLANLQIEHYGQVSESFEALLR